MFSRASEARARLYNSMILTPEQICRINHCGLEAFKEYLDKYDTVNSIVGIKDCLIANEENFQKIAYCNK